MIHIAFDPSKLTDPEQLKWWKDWLETSEEYTKDAIKQYEEDGKVEFHVDHWSALKHWLLENVFNHKCAYCEGFLVKVSGDAEHYRPKGNVKDLADEVKDKWSTVETLDCSGKKTKHPGYFWLAYDWHNLLPSCEGCNRMEAKFDKFPTKNKEHILAKFVDKDKVRDLKGKYYKSGNYKNYYYLSTEELNLLENQFLLHPYYDQPRDYIKFGYAGIESPVDPNNIKATNTIKVFNLKDTLLRTARQKAQEAGLREYGMAYLNAKGDIEEKVKAGKEKISAIIDGREPYSAAIIDWIEQNVHYKIVD